MFAGFYKLCREFLAASKTVFGLALLLYFLVYDNYYLLFELQPDAAMWGCFFWGLVYYFRFIGAEAEGKGSDIRKAYLLFMASFLFLQKILMLLAILLIAAFVAEDAAPAAVYMPVLLVLLFPMNFSRGSLPEINTEMAAQMEIVEQVLREDAADAGSDPWNSTLAYAYDDTVFHGYLYAVPDGMGIEFDKNSYLWDAENPYVMCGHGTRVEERLLAESWQELVSTEDLVIYKRS